jgi:tetratricopeptide (TPR) repeat protein
VGTACAGPSLKHKATLNTMIASRDWAGAATQLKTQKASEYTQRDEVLYWLDLAAVLHDAGSYRESDEALDRAEQRLDALYTQSISKGAGTFFLNDTTDDYRGDPHERALLHILRALNYAYDGKTDEAVVESRKVTALLTQLGDSVGSKYAYRDDAFAQYLSGLLFEDAGRSDDARISFQAAHAAFGSYTTTYGTPEPAWMLGPLKRDEGEIVFLHYAGVAPRRQTDTVQVAWNDAMVAIRTSGNGDSDSAKAQNAITAGLIGDAITVAFPRQVQDPFAITGSEIEVAGQRAPTLLVEDISAIAKRALDDRMDVIRSRAIARAATKFVLAKAAEEAVKRTAGDGWGRLAGLATRVTAAATEVADTRCWLTLPAQIRMARIRVPAGAHTVDVRYSNASGQFTNGETIPVEVKSGRRTYVHVRTAI